MYLERSTCVALLTSVHKWEGGVGVENVEELRRVVEQADRFLCSSIMCRDDKEKEKRSVWFGNGHTFFTDKGGETIRGADGHKQNKTSKSVNRLNTVKRFQKATTIILSLSSGTYLLGGEGRYLFRGIDCAEGRKVRLTPLSRTALYLRITQRLKLYKAAIQLDLRR